MPTLILNLEKCVHNGKNDINCPYAGSARTMGAGFAEDYFCKLMPDLKSDHGYKGTSGYDERDNEIRPIPIWCPIMAVEEKVLKIFEK